MFKVIKEIRFCYGHRLLDYVGKCSRLHGHNGRVEIELSSSELDSRGMVFDFEDIKREIQTWIDAELDHKMILRRDDPLAETLIKLKEPCLLLEVNLTAECLAKLVFDYALSCGFPVSEVKFWETDSSCATYRRLLAGPKNQV